MKKFYKLSFFFLVCLFQIIQGSNIEEKIDLNDKAAKKISTFLLLNLYWNRAKKDHKIFQESSNSLENICKTLQNPNPPLNQESKCIMEILKFNLANKNIEDLGKLESSFGKLIDFLERNKTNPTIQHIINNSNSLEGLNFVTVAIGRLPIHSKLTEKYLKLKAADLTANLKDRSSRSKEQVSSCNIS